MIYGVNFKEGIVKETREFLKSIGLPGGDAYDLPDSQKRVSGWRTVSFEVPGIQGRER